MTAVAVDVVGVWGEFQIPRVTPVARAVRRFDEHGRPCVARTRRIARFFDDSRLVSFILRLAARARARRHQHRIFGTLLLLLLPKPARYFAKRFLFLFSKEHKSRLIVKSTF